MRLTVVIPMYNEEKIIFDNLKTLLLCLGGGLEPEDFEVIAVNDGSTDRTEELVKALLPLHNNLRLVSYEQNKGKGYALKQGIAEARGDFVLFTDSDLAYGAPVVLSFLSAFEEGKGQMILGSRPICPDGYSGYTLLRRIASKCYLRIVRFFSGFSFSDSQCGIKGFERDLAKSLFGALETCGFAFDLEILLAAADRKTPYYELPVRILNHSSSTVHPFADAFRMLKDLRKIKKRRKKAAAAASREP